MKTSEPTHSMNLTRHAAKRMQQRSIRNDTVDLFLRYADREKPVGDGVVALMFSEEGASDLLREGVPGSEVGSRLTRITVLIDESTAEVVTACWLHGRKARAYTVDAAWN